MASRAVSTFARRNFFESARLLPMLSSADLARMVQDFYALVLAQDNRFRLESALPLDEATRLARVAHYVEVAARQDSDVTLPGSGDHSA